MGCHWVRRLVRGLVGPTTSNTTPHQRFLVKPCASANNPCMVGGWVQFGRWGFVGEWVAGCVGWCVNWLVPPTVSPPTTNISLFKPCASAQKPCVAVGGLVDGGCNINISMSVNNNTCEKSSPSKCIWYI